MCLRQLDLSENSLLQTVQMKPVVVVSTSSVTPANTRSLESQLLSLLQSHGGPPACADVPLDVPFQETCMAEGAGQLV